MNALKRILANMTKNFGQLILLLVAVLTFGVLISGALSMLFATQEIAEGDTEINTTGVAIVRQDFETIDDYEHHTGIRLVAEPFTLEQAKKIGSLPYVKNYDLAFGELLYSKDMERVRIDGASFDFGFGDWNTFHLAGAYSSNFIMIEEGIIEIVSGRTFSEEEINSLSYVALVSQSLADENDLYIGSTFTLENIVWEDVVWRTNAFTEENIFARQSYSFEVIGIFERTIDIITGDPESDSWTFAGFDNSIHTPNPTATTIQAFSMESQKKQDSDFFFSNYIEQGELPFQNIYVLNNYRYMENFMFAAQEFLPELNVVVDITNTKGLQPVMSGVEELNQLAEIVLLTSVVAAVLVLFLLLALIMRDRRDEISDYLALGEKKAKIATRVTAELLPVVIASLVLSLFAGNVLARNISESMIEQELTTVHENPILIESMGIWGFLVGDTLPEVISMNYDISLNVSTILSFALIGVAMSAMVVIISALYIAKVNPKKDMSLLQSDSERPIQKSKL